jgi:hypothetical protein
MSSSAFICGSVIPVSSLSRLSFPYVFASLQ